MPAGKKLPKYCLHTATGQAFVWLDGKNHYLGPYDSPESKSRYRELVEAWQLRDDQTQPVELRIGELILLYLEHARGYYRKNGKPTSEVGWIESSLRFLIPLAVSKQLVRPDVLVALEALSQNSTLIEKGACCRS